MSKVDVMVYVCRDSWGNEYSAVVDDPSDTIQLCGMRDVHDLPVEGFESDAWHASDWAAKHKLELTVHTFKLDLEAQRADDWKVTFSTLLPMKRVYVKKENLEAARVHLWGAGLGKLDEQTSDTAKWAMYFVLNERWADVLLRGMASDGLPVLLKDHQNTP
jgi:hypothetical protein